MANKPPVPFPSAGKKDVPGAPAKAPVGLPVAKDETYVEDFSDVQEGYPLVAPGFHHAKVIDMEKAESRSGNPQYVWQFRITDGPAKDMELRYWTSLLPQARWKVAETLDALGIKASGTIARFSKKDVIGRPCVLEIAQEAYEGSLRSKVVKVHTPNDDTVRLAGGSDTPF